MSLGFGFRERECHFSLRSWAIRPSDRFESRRKTVLHIVDYTWAPVSGVFDKLHEVWVLSYLFYTLFKCFVMFELVEAVRGRLIGPKTLDRIVGNFGDFLDCP